MNKSQWMIYGATGYTGKLIVREAIKQGMKPILAGRRADAVRAEASVWDLPWKAFDLNEAESIERNLDGVALVLHCAGPFSSTSRAMVDACLKKKVHYLDITGEISVFEEIHHRNAEAKKRGVVLLPGVGFDVVPSDCLAKELADRLPDARTLELAFAGAGGVSPGTLKTALESFPSGGKIRRDGKIVDVPTGKLAKKVRFTKKETWVSAIPWGDVSTAYYSTGIPNITVYGPMPRALIKATRLMQPLAPLFKHPSVQQFLKSQIDRRVQGPTEEARLTGRMSLWGRVINSKGQQVEGRLEVPEGYHFTAISALASTHRVLEGEVKPGAWTPAMAFGSRFVTKLPGTKMTLQNDPT